VGSPHSLGSFQMKIFQIPMYTLPLRAIRKLNAKFQHDMMILKNQYGSPNRTLPYENFTNLSSYSSFRTHLLPLHQISAFYENFEILVHNTPPTQTTPTGQPVDQWRFCPSSNSVPNFVQYASRKNFKSIGQLVPELPKDRQTDGRTWQLHKPWFGLKTNVDVTNYGEFA